MKASHIMMLRDAATFIFGMGAGIIGNGTGMGPAFISIGIVAFYIAVNLWHAEDARLFKHIKDLEKLIDKQQEYINTLTKE